MEPYHFDKSKLDLNFLEERAAILVSCGSFNPVTLAHLQIFEIARDYIEKEHGLNVIGGFMSPVHDGYNKPGLIPLTHRLEMCKKAVEDSDWVSVDSWEASQQTYTKTLFVLQHFQRQINEAAGKHVQVLLLCGADLLRTLETPKVWDPEHVECILRDFGLAVVERDDFSVSEHIFKSDLLYRYRRNILNISKYIKNDLSSTQVRHLRRRGYSIRYFVPNSVLKYIEENNLFLAQK